MTAEAQADGWFRIGDRVLVARLGGRACLRRGSQGIVIDDSADRVAVWFGADRVEYLRPEQLWPVSISG